MKRGIILAVLFMVIAGLMSSCIVRVRAPRHGNSGHIDSHVDTQHTGSSIH